MLFHILIISSLISSISCGISCYHCTSAPSLYTGILTAENLPKEIQNCDITTNYTKCYIGMRWYLTMNETGIELTPYQDDPSSIKDILEINADLSGIGVTRETEQSMNYYCSTDRCNDANQLKRLLESLSLKSDFNDFDNILQPDPLFNGSDCLYYSNLTYADCRVPPTINPINCKQCTTHFISDSSKDSICAGCNVGQEIFSSLEREVIFSMTDRTQSDRWSIYCYSKNCNGLETGQHIKNKSTIKFDFDKFFAANSANMQTTIISLNKILAISIVLIAKAFK